MKVFFSCSLHHQDKYASIYQRITTAISKAGYEILSPYFGKSIPPLCNHNRLHEEALNLMKVAEAFVFEVTYPSTITQGHLVSLALSKNKPVLALAQKDLIPPVFEKLENVKFILAEYLDSNLETVINRELESLIKLIEYRFSFQLPFELFKYMEELEEQGINRSQYIRSLIQKDLEKKQKGIGIKNCVKNSLRGIWDLTKL